MSLFSISANEALDLYDAGGGPDEEILEFVAQRGITEVLHFTTNQGLVGTLGVGELLSRAKLPQTSYLEHVYSPNSVRKDHAWLDFVNLSITDINEWMFERSTAWHESEDVWWVCLSFNPRILALAGAVFTTTNNIYPSVRRGVGVDGLKQLFAPRVFGRYQTEHLRTGKNSAQPTDRQAEVLIPHGVSVSELQTIYIQRPEHADDIAGIFACLPGGEIPIEVRPEVFR